MKVISARNVNDALIKGLSALSEEGVDRDSRNGPVRVFPGPVTTYYEKPKERVIFFPERDANPYFHFMESLWMVAGRNDVAWITEFSSNIANYSDDGVSFHGGYGTRWRAWFDDIADHGSYGGIDQLSIIAEILQDNPDDRRVVLQMWSVEDDLGRDGKDFPCNLIATFRINPYGKLDMTVFNRSNDMIWGAYGANAVHFSVLQEVMAAWVGVPVGSYWQVSTNFHSYHNTLEKHGSARLHIVHNDPYALKEVEPFSIVNTDIETWMQDLDMFMQVGEAIGYRDRFFKRVALPMLKSWRSWKNRENPNFRSDALRWAYDIEATDWRRACVEWLERRS